MVSRRVLITGGAGFLGTQLTNCFLENGIDVRLLDLDDSNPLGKEKRRLEFIKGDVCNEDIVREAFKGVDSVIHAAFASPRQSRDTIERVNVDATRNLCKAASRHGVGSFILISSTVVHWSQRKHPFLKNSPLTRFDFYRSSRIEAEKIVTNSRNDGFSVAVARPKTFIGPGRVGAFAIIFESIRLGKYVPILGAGRNRYQLLDIRDMAEGVRLLESEKSNGTFYFGAKEYQTVRQDLQMLVDHAKTGAELRFIPERCAKPALRAMELANMVPLSEWHYMSTRGKDSVVDISRAENELMWNPKRSNARALIDAYDWYVSSMSSAGTASTTHPVPLMHKILYKLSWLYHR